MTRTAPVSRTARRSADQAATVTRLSTRVSSPWSWLAFLPQSLVIVATGHGSVAAIREVCGGREGAGSASDS